jgi:hypothetical protein
VIRGANNSDKTAHDMGTKIYTDSQVTSTLGWMGQPLGPASHSPLTTPNLIANPNFHGTPSNSSFLANWTVAVDSGGDSSVVQDNSGQEINGNSDGTAVSFTITRNALSGFPNNLATTVYNIVPNQPYTLSFYAKSNHNVRIAMVIVSSGKYTPNYQQCPTYWQLFNMVFVVCLLPFSCELLMEIITVTS